VRRAVALVLVGIASVQLGASIAKHLFSLADPSTVVWLRLTTSALVLALLARPVLRGRSRTDWWVVLGFAATLGLMNWSFYQAFARLPLGVAVTIEFIGPLALAVVGLRRARDLAWVALAAVGVVLLGWERTELDWLGVALALLAGGCWAGYILLSAETGRRWAQVDGLAVASVVAALVLTPVALGVDAGAVLDPVVLGVGAAVGVLSSVVPYAAEMVALRTLAPATFGILMSLEPAAAALAGLAVLGETLGVAQWVAVACVVVASVGVTRSARAARFTQLSHERDTTVARSS